MSRQANLINFYERPIHDHPNLQRRAKKKGYLKQDQVIIDAEVQSQLDNEIEIDVEETRAIQKAKVISSYHIVVSKAEFERIKKVETEEKSKNKIDKDAMGDPNGRDEEIY